MSELALQVIADNKAKHARGEDALLLDLGNCGLSEIPQEALECVWVETLILSSEWKDYDEDSIIVTFKSQNSGLVNQIDAFPARLHKLKGLKKIICRHQPLSDLSPLKKLMFLEELLCSGSKIADLSPLADLVNLKILSIGGTQVTDLAHISLVSLKELHCNSTEISDLSPLQGLKNLQTLSCASTQVTDWSPLQDLTNLQILNCSSTQIFDLSLISSLQSLKALYCSSTEVSDLSPISSLKGLKELYCSSTKVSDLSPLKGLTNLQRLECNSTQISDLSPISSLKGLKELYCSSTKVSDLSPLKGLTNLQRLSCNSMQVNDLSPLQGLINLQFLRCESTKVTDLSPLSNLTQIKTLLINNTPISDLSPLANLSNIEVFYCYNTPVSDISPLMALFVKSLPTYYQNYHEFISGKNENSWWEYSSILLKDCPLTNPPVEIAKQGTEAILNWFEEQKKQGVVKINEAKLLILGEGGVGKTTLAKKIDHGFSYGIAPESTHGIDIHTYTFGCENGQSFKTNIWDFGGQEIYHATHQFFLTKRSLYILMDDARKEDTRFDYWLQIVSLLSSDSPVIIVQNCKAGRRRDLDESGMREQFKNILGFYYLDLSQDVAEFKKLIKRVKLELQLLPHTNEAWVSNWLSARRDLEALKEEGSRYITYENYCRICEQHKLSEIDTESLGQYLHDLGIILYFHDDPILRRTVFLDSQWIVNGVYEVLDDKEIQKGKGIFYKNDAKKIWDKTAYRRMYDELLQLMMKFELCYQIVDRPDYYLVPHLLPASSPNTSWTESESLQLNYRYGFMPKGLLSRLIVRLNRYVKNTDEAWRAGVVFEREDARARVVETRGEKYLKIQARGSEARELITVISDEIDRLNNGYHRLKVEKQVPCICATCLRMDEPNFYDYEDLMRRRKVGKRTIECKYSYDAIDVLRLLDNVFVTTFFKPRTLQVFVSYSKADKVHLEALKTHLSILRREESLISWDDTQLIPGEEWDSRIRRQLASCDIVILLVSSDFMATDYIWEEIKIALDRHERGEAVVVPVIVRSCDWTSASFAKLAALPSKGKPVVQWNDQDEAWSLVVKSVRDLSKKLKMIIPTSNYDTI